MYRFWSKKTSATADAQTEMINSAIIPYSPAAAIFLLFEVECGADPLAEDFKVIACAEKD
jgi:hypothetical protein